MSDLTSSVAALAEFLEQQTGVQANVTESPSAATVIDIDEILAMPLDRFAHEGQLVEVRVPWLDATLWFVPSERDAAILGQEGVRRGRVWTAGELKTVMALPDPPHVVQSLAIAKREVDGEVVESQPRKPGMHEGSKGAHHSGVVRPVWNSCRCAPLGMSPPRQSSFPRGRSGTSSS